MGLILHSSIGLGNATKDLYSNICVRKGIAGSLNAADALGFEYERACDSLC